MEKTNLLALVITLTVGIILTGAVLAPLIEDYSAETNTYENEGTPFKLMAEAPETPTITISKVDDKLTFISDDEAISSPDFSLYGNVTIVYGTAGFVRLSESGQLRIFQENVQGLTISDTVSVTITLTDTNVVVTPSDGSATRTVAIKPVAYIGNGSYVQTVSPRINETSEIYLAGTTNYDGVTHYINYIGYGLTEELTTLTVYSDLGNGVTVEDLEHTVNATNLTTNLYKIDNIKFVATDSDDREYESTFSFFIAPKDIVYNNPNYIGEQYTSILGAVVILVIVSLVLAAASALYLKRGD